MDDSMTDTTTLYAHFAARIDAVLDALEMEGSLPPETDRSNVPVRVPVCALYIVVTRAGRDLLS